MRWSRAGIVVGVIGLVLLGTGWLAGLGSAGPAGRASAVAIRAPGGQLLRQLQQLLAPHQVHPAPRVAPEVHPAPRLAPAVHGTTCFVGAGGFCSLTPCVVPAATGTAATGTAPGSDCRAAGIPQQALRVGVPRLDRPATFRWPTP